MPTILVFPASYAKDGPLDYESILRIKKAFEVYQRLRHQTSPDDIFIVSSVQDRRIPNEPSQSEGIKDRLTRLGVPAKQIVISNESSTTLDDIRCSFELTKKRNLPQPIINVSSWYHIPRIWLIWKLLAKRMGYPKLNYVAAGSSNHLFVLEEPRKTWRLLQRWRKRLL